MTDVLVAGGGLAGLVAARHLAADGFDVTVFEKEPTVGGRVRTTREDGFTYDRGFQVVFDSYPAVQRELDVDGLDLRQFAPGATLARPGERSVISDPLRDPRTMTQTLFNREITVGDKLRVLQLRRELAGREEADIFDPAGPDRTIEAALADRGFSRAFGQRFVAPFYGGITLDRSLSTDARIFEYTFARLTDGSAAVPADGMSAIPEQLARRAREAGARIETGETVESIESDGVGEAAKTGDDVAVTVTFTRRSGERVTVAGRPLRSTIPAGGRAPFVVRLEDRAAEPTAVEAATTYETGAPSPYDGLTVLDHDVTDRSESQVTVNGRVENRGGERVGARVIATFYDGNGSVVGVRSVPTSPRVLGPGGAGEFEVRLRTLGNVPSRAGEVESYELSLVAEASS